MTDITAEIDPQAVRRHVQTLQDLNRQKLCERILRWLCGEDMSRRVAAELICRRGGAVALDLLVGEFVAARKPASSKLKLLGVIERLGIPLSASQTLQLMWSQPRVGEEVYCQALVTMSRLRQVSAAAADLAPSPSPDRATGLAPGRTDAAGGQT